MIKNRYYGFCDLENLGRIERIDFTRYEKLYLFVGNNQEITDQEKLLLSLTDSYIINVDKGGKDALDKILILYTGLVHTAAEPEIIFEVISKDKGFDILRAFLEPLGRKYQRNGSHKYKIDLKTRLFLTLFSVDKSKRPKRLEGLKNFIRSTSIYKSAHDTLDIEFIMSMVALKCIIIEKDQTKDPHITYCDP